MGLVENMQPHMKNALLEIPQAHRGEVSGVLTEEFDFEQWRNEQDPVVDDTPANRADFIALMMARYMFSHIRRLLTKSRASAATESVGSDLNSQ